MRPHLIVEAEKGSLRKDEFKFQVGDTVQVHLRILDKDKERIQIFEGTVIARRGTGTQETFTVRRIVQNEGVERVFPLHSPKIADIVVKRMGKARRAKLYYLRDRVGKATRTKERRPKASELGEKKKRVRRKRTKKAAPPAE